VTEALLSARGVHVRYGTTPVVLGVDLTLREGDELALVGRSGSGKTSLLLALSGLLTPTEGVVERQGLGPRDIAVIFQSPSLVPELSCVENVALPLRLAPDAPTAAEAHARARDVLAGLGVDAPDALPGQVSGGQQQRVAVARVLVTGARVILADEPTGALDATSAALVLDALRRHCTAHHGALLVATHDLRVADALPRRLHLSDGLLEAAAA
jgi:ABC-type lipoprotein export system ATPase subunit